MLMDADLREVGAKKYWHSLWTVPYTKEYLNTGNFFYVKLTKLINFSYFSNAIQDAEKYIP